MSPLGRLIAAVMLLCASLLVLGADELAPATAATFVCAALGVGLLRLEGEGE